MTTIKNQTTGRILVILKSTDTHYMVAKSKHGGTVEHVEKRAVGPEKEWVLMEDGR